MEKDKLKKHKIIKKVRNHEPSLIQKIIKGKYGGLQSKQEKVNVVESIKQCKYGVSCAHLRTKGICNLSHQKNHYLFLNIVPPADCIQSNKQSMDGISKFQQKQNKIIQKIISEKIDMDQISRRRAEQIKMKQLNEMNHKEKQVFELVNCTNQYEYFCKWKQFSQENKLTGVQEIKSKSLLQLKKKNESIYNDILLIEFKICQYLKQRSTNKQNNIQYQIYLDLQIAQSLNSQSYSQAYEKVRQQQQIQVQIRKEPKIIAKKRQKFKQFFQNEQNNGRILSFYTSTPQAIKFNINYLNLCVPYSIINKLHTIKYIYFDCKEEITFNTATQKICQDHLSTYHTKCKSNTYNFGQFQANKTKFISWINKIHKKYEQNSIEIVLLIENDSILSKKSQNASEFGMQKCRQSIQVMSVLVRVFRKNVVILMRDGYQGDDYLTKLIGWIGQQSLSQINLNQIAAQ